MGHFAIFSSFLDMTLPVVKTIEGTVNELTLQIIVSVTALLGVYIAYRLYIKIPVSQAEDVKQSLIQKYFLIKTSKDTLELSSQVASHFKVETRHQDISGILMKIVRMYLSIFQCPSNNGPIMHRI